MNSAVSERNFWGNRMQNHVFYPTFLIALEMLDKEGVAIDTVFCSLSICMPNPEYSKNIIVSPWGHRKHQDWCGTTHLGIGVLKVLFQVKLTKMPLVNLGLTKSQSWVKINLNQHFSCFYTKPKLLGGFCRL